MKSRHEVSAGIAANKGTFENEADKAVLRDIEAALQAGGDPFGDNDADLAETAAAPAPESKEQVEAETTDEGASASPPEVEPTAQTEETEKAAAPDAKPQSGAEESVAPAEPEAAPPHVEQPADGEPQLYRTEEPEQLKARRDQLLADKKKAFAEYSDGKMSADDYFAVDTKVSDGLADIQAQLTLMHANAQSQQQHAERALARVQADAATEGLIDYSVDAHRAEFNAAVAALERVEANANLSAQQFYAKAHQMVKAMNGHATKAPAAAPPPPAAPPRQAPPAPVTLRNVPAASTPNTNGSVGEQLSRLDGLDFQAAIGRMPREQRDAWMDS